MIIYVRNFGEVTIVEIIFILANVPMRLEQLGRSVFSELDGNPPIWVTKISPDVIYVNQAKVIYHLANYEHNNAKGKLQVRDVYIIIYIYI